MGQWDEPRVFNQRLNLQIAQLLEEVKFELEDEGNRNIMPSENKRKCGSEGTAPSKKAGHSFDKSAAVAGKRPSTPEFTQDQLTQHALLEDLPADQVQGKGRACYVTVGASATFRELLEEVISPGFIEFLAHFGYKKLTVQCGEDFEWFAQEMQKLKTFHGMRVVALKYTKDPMPYFVECRSEVLKRLSGCVIAHGGAGSILDGNRYGAPLIAVPNPSLMNNHQEELVAAAAEKGWCLHGKLGKLTESVIDAKDAVISGGKENLPPYEEPPFPTPEDERCTLFDWMVLTCYPGKMLEREHLAQLQEQVSRASGAESARLQLD